MAVPAGDDRDHNFAKHFNIPITNIFGEKYNGEAAYTDKSGTLDNSDFLNGMDVAQALPAAIAAIEEKGIGKARVNYKMRDAGFSRQRYWGEPFPIVYINDVPYAVDEKEVAEHGLKETLPTELPMVEHYKPGPEGQGPLANVTEWVNTPAGTRETNTMPGYAGSSWYFLRYMDPHNDATFADKKVTDYWREVDVYVGGTEHAVGHLLYSRLWTKVLFDLGHISFEEPFKKLVNQGMIQGVSYFVAWDDKSKKLVSYDIVTKGGNKDAYLEKRVPVEYLLNGKFDVSKTNAFLQEFDLNGYEFVKNEAGEIELTSAVEKMSKSKRNVINPDDIVTQYGADTFRMYEMFLGPIDVSKPWDTKGIEGVHRFLKKMWRLYADEQKGWIVTDEPATEAELRILHKTIKKVGEDIERFSFNTSVSQFMICVNELSALNCHKRAILEPLAITIAAFAPHLAEELWHKLGNGHYGIGCAIPATRGKIHNREL